MSDKSVSHLELTSSSEGLNAKFYTFIMDGGMLWITI